MKNDNSHAVQSIGNRMLNKKIKEVVDVTFDNCHISWSYSTSTKWCSYSIAGRMEVIYIYGAEQAKKTFK